MSCRPNQRKITNIVLNILFSNAFNLHIYLQIDRKDLARKELKLMQERDDDATLTQLAQAWFNIALVCNGN